MPLLVLLFIALPILELLIIIQVARGVGVGLTVGLLILTAVLGAVLLRSQGRTAWARFNLALSEGRIPATETFDGAMIILGGALLLTPGFVTDVTGLALLAPPSRALVRRGVGGMARRRMAFTWRIVSPGSRGSGAASGPDTEPGPGADPGSERPRRGYDYEGSAREVGEDERGLPGGERDG